MYHNIVEPSKDLPWADAVYDLSLSEFEKQMKYLYEENFHVISLKQFSEHGQQGKTLPKKGVILTFDDGLHSHRTNVLPILKRYHFSGDFFITVNNIGKPGYMTWEGVEALSKAGMGIGSHALNHVFLEDLYSASIEAELRTSKVEIENRLGIEVPFFAPPGGRINRNVIALARSVGYLGMCTSRVGLARPSDDPFLLKRFPIKRTLSLDHFISVVHQRPWLLWEYQIKIGVYRLAQKILGNETYDRIRKRAMRHLFAISK